MQHDEAPAGCWEALQEGNKQVTEVLDRTTQEYDDDIDFEILSATEEAYRGFYYAFEVFNIQLFGNTLPDVMITMQRSKRSRGYFSSERFGHRRGTEVVDEDRAEPAYIRRSHRQADHLNAGARDGASLAISLRQAGPARLSQQGMGRKDD